MTTSSHLDAEGRTLYKDVILNRLAQRYNVAQFVSFSPDLSTRYSRIRGYRPNHRFGTSELAAKAALAAAPERLVNIRSFDPYQPENKEFVYGLSTVDQVVSQLARLADQGLYTIVNETIDVNDGGVSGVVLGEIIEFAPGDTPRAVEKPGIASFPRSIGLKILSAVYGFLPKLTFASDTRVEFSLHPGRRGIRNEHTVIWQVEKVGRHPLQAAVKWPNVFSRFVGDKVFGLLYAHALGLRVPHTIVVPRRLPPFQFGKKTGTGETWLRTAPREQQPGLFSTLPKWSDPFVLLEKEDPTGHSIASIIAQEGVDPVYSGAVITSEHKGPIIEGVRGRGDDFMVGKKAPSKLPREVVKGVMTLYRMALRRAGPVRMEWVFDGERAYVVQFHRGAVGSSDRIVVPGSAKRFTYVQVSSGLEALRDQVAKAQAAGEGIVLVGNVGMTSHYGDVLRRAGVPSRIESIDAIGSADDIGVTFR